MVKFSQSEKYMFIPLKRQEYENKLNHRECNCKVKVQGQRVKVQTSSALNRITEAEC